MTEPEVRKADVCVYGATASGIVAAVAAARRGRSVVVVEPSRWLGGMIGGGIRITTDCEYPNHVGGITRALLLRERMFNVWDHDSGQAELRAMWRDLLAQFDVDVVREHRVAQVDKRGATIVRATFDLAPPDAMGVPAAEAQRPGALAVEAGAYIDASYEGDLLALARVSCRVGRESRAEYGESLAGVRHVQKFPGIDPYRRAGEPDSGLLSLIPPDPLGAMGEASRFLIPFNFRFVRAMVSRGTGPTFADPPGRVEPDHAALVRRALDAGHLPPRSSTNYNRRSPLTGTIPGVQADYPDGDWPTRAAIWRTLIEHDRLVAQVTGVKLPLAADMFPDTAGCPHQLYIRMARRMVGEYVVTQSDLARQTDVPDPVGLAYYNVDIYPCRLVVLDDGTLATEGETWELVSPGPYPIPYRALTPRAEECGNLLASVCVSASHVACSSIRMEPTFMILGESAGTAAALAVERACAVQAVAPDALDSALRDAGQILEWDQAGYGPYWFNRRFEAWWEKHPEEYARRPVPGEAMHRKVISDTVPGRNNPPS